MGFCKGLRLWTTTNGQSNETQNDEIRRGLGYMYRQGLGVRQDYAKARALFEAAGIEGLDIVN